ncbi:MAG: UDP-2,3-diacylglucosamine diphosphatase [Gammaproteobacteria bacterium]
MRVRTLFLSDTHLGFKRARVHELVEFLRGVEAGCIVLVGDIVDALSLARRAFWSDGHTQVLRALLAKRRAGARLIYTPGNHDESVGLIAELLRGQVEVHREWAHRTAAGERLLVLHGDQFDAHIAGGAWLDRVGSAMYDLTVALNDRLNDVRRLLGKPYWPLAEHLKLAIDASAGYIARFEAAAASHARAYGFDGVVCGHIHRASLRRVGEIVYCNTGDWVESCSAVIETERGELQLWRWTHGASLPAAPLPARATCDRTGRSRVPAFPVPEVSL